MFICHLVIYTGQRVIHAFCIPFCKYGLFSYLCIYNKLKNHAWECKLLFEFTIGQYQTIDQLTNYYFCFVFF